MSPIHMLRATATFTAILWITLTVSAQATTTWDGRFQTDNIEVTVVYFVPADRTPLPDWQNRVQYFCGRIELFHQREFQGQSTLKTVVHAQPFVSERSTRVLRQGDQNAIYFQTLREVDRRLEFAKDPSETFRILLVLSEINWRPLDDFYRLHPLDERSVAPAFSRGDKNDYYQLNDERFVFEGVYQSGQHHPGATSGGARASYLADRGVGWGLVSADGWRVPYRGSDCVVYHEGCGHTVGLPHPEPGNGSVMSQAQYIGWINESWLDKEQKSKLGWEPGDESQNPSVELFTKFRALPEPAVPKPNQKVELRLDWPEAAKVKSLRVRYQTAVTGPWVDVTNAWDGDAPKSVSLTAFDRPTPVSYRVDVELENGAKSELWGYFQVREDPEKNPLPFDRSPDLISPHQSESLPVATLPTNEVDLLELADPTTCWKTGDWSLEDDKLLSPKQFGARLELPYTPPEEYRMILIVEPLDSPNALLLGQRTADHRFATLFNFAKDGKSLSAIENVDGRNVGNETTFTGQVFQQNRLSEVIVTVTKTGVQMSVDGHKIVDWIGQPDQLSLGEYWSTPRSDALTLGTYDCRYRFHRVTLEPIR